MQDEIDGVKVTAASGLVTLTDRWGGELTDRPSSEDGDQAAIARLVDSMADEVTFVVRRESDGAYGILLEPYERPHSESGDDPKDVECPPEEQVLKELADEAAKANAAYPGLDAWVESGPDVFLGRAAVRAFLPEGSPLLDRSGEIATALLEGTVRTAPAP